MKGGPQSNPGMNYNHMEHGFRPSCSAANLVGAIVGENNEGVGESR